jgi:hypothetical protein
MIGQTFRLLFQPGVTEMRILHTPRSGTVSGYFDDAVAFVNAAQHWSGAAPGVYATLNPTIPALLARAHNRLRDRARETTADTDIVERRWLPLDFDSIRPSGISSTDAEHRCAFARALVCRDWLGARGWPAPIEADSGNGAHLLYCIHLPNDAASRDLLKRVLEALALFFSDDLVNVDTTVHNAARIWKVYGTMACKGDSLPERPHRLARLLAVPATIDAVSLALLESLAALLPTPPPAPARPRYAGTEPFDLERWIADHGLPVVSHGPWGSGYRWVLSPCPWNADHTNRSAFIVRLPSGAIAAGCHHNSCQGNDWHALRDMYEPGWRDRHAPGGRPQQDFVDPWLGPRSQWCGVPLAVRRMS